MTYPWTACTPEHDGLEPLSAFSVWQALAKGPGVARNHGFTKLVAILRRSIAGIYQDLQTLLHLNPALCGKPTRT